MKGMFPEIDVIPPGESFDGPMQMGLDEALLSHAERPTLRFYRWEAPCVTFGYFLKHAEVRNLHPLLPLIRRRTGGGIVEHGSDLTFSIVVPRKSGGGNLSPAAFYRELHRRIAGWLLAAASLPVRLASGEDLVSGNSCFSAPSGNDLMLGGEKILGGAQRRSAGALLYQGSLRNVGWEGLDLLAFARNLAGQCTTIRLDDRTVRKACDEALQRYRREEWNARI